MILPNTLADFIEGSAYDFEVKAHDIRTVYEWIELGAGGLIKEMKRSKNPKITVKLNILQCAGLPPRNSLGALLDEHDLRAEDIIVTSIDRYEITAAIIEGYARRD